MTLGQIKKPLSSKDGSAALRNGDTGATFRKLFNMNWTIGTTYCMLVHLYNSEVVRFQFGTSLV